MRTLHDKKWWEKFTELEAIWLAGGDPNVLKSHPTHGLWLMAQRTAYKVGKLGKSRTQALEALGVKLNYNEDRWEEMFEGLKVIAHENGGNPNVQQNQPTHGRWLNAQKSFQRDGKLPADREQTLEAIGVKWAKPHRPK